LVPGGPLELFEGLAQVGLRDVHDPNLQHLVGFGVGDQVMQATPRPFEFLEIGMMQDLVDLSGELLVDRRDHRLDRGDGVIGDDGRVLQGLGSQGLHRRRDRLLRPVSLRLEFLFQQCTEIVGGDRRTTRGGRLGLRIGHGNSLA
jgi:hypothetical protein